nr:hypothetical protein [uncultured Trichococcus sp.]
MVEMLKKVYLKHEDTGAFVFVGYDVQDLSALEAIGYRIGRMYEEDFTKAKKRGVVYIKGEMLDAKEDAIFLFNKKGSWIGEAYKINK